MALPVFMLPASGNLSRRQEWPQGALSAGCRLLQRWCRAPPAAAAGPSRLSAVAPAGVPGAPPEDRAAAAPPAPPAEAGPLLPAQHDRPDSAHVHVRPAGPLDGVHLVRHRKNGEGRQQPSEVGSW